MAKNKKDRQRAQAQAAEARRIAEERRARTQRLRQIVIAIVALCMIGAVTLSIIVPRSQTTSSTTSPTTTSPTTTSPTTTPPTVVIPTTTPTTSTAPVTSTTTPAATTSTTASPRELTQAQVNAAALAAGCPTSPTQRVNTLTWKSAPPMSIDTKATYFAHFVTTQGSFVVRLDAASAPITTNNFIFLARHNFYHCVEFHRVIPGFMIQGGDPTGTGTGGPGYTIADEYPKLASPTYPLYSVAMANTGAPHSGGSQFFIVTGTAGENLPNTYSLFGRVVSGTAVIQAISAEGNANPSANGEPPRVLNRILSVTVTTAP